jgi:hypothetical protein
LNRAACTIVSPNYLHFARTLSRSYLAQHPDHRFFVLIVADIGDVNSFEGEGFTPVALTEIGVQDLRSAAMKYDILELNTNVKPTFLAYLLERYGLDAVVYLDPDVFVYAPLEPVFRVLEGGATAVLTPHITAPVFDGRSPGEQDLLYNGTYNLGFIALGRTPEGDRMLRWWEERCLQLGFSEGRTGLFVDQKWMNLAPGLFDRVVILRDAGCNMAYWNLHERRLVPTPSDGWLVENAVGQPVPLRFFHFSGVALDDPGVISRNTDRFTLKERPDLKLVLDEYRAAIRKQQRPGDAACAYGFDRLSDGTAVGRLARRLYAEHEARFRSPNGQNRDPFDARGPFAAFARAHGLVKGKAAPGKSTWKEFNPRDRRVRAVHRLLKVALRALGPHRYELLMRYLSHISVLRHQSVFLRDRRWTEPAKGE